jgi:hypothetical protein
MPSEREIEAAAKAYWESNGKLDWQAQPTDVRNVIRELARVALVGVVEQESSHRLTGSEGE